MDLAREEVIKTTPLLSRDAIYSTVQFFHTPMIEFLRIEGEPGDADPVYPDIWAVLKFYSEDRSY